MQLAKIGAYRVKLHLHLNELHLSPIASFSSARRALHAEQTIHLNAPLQSDQIQFSKQPEKLDY